MKKTKRFAWAILALSFGVSACNFGNLNSDPTKSTDMDPNLILSNLQVMPTNDYQEWHRHMMYPGGFVQQWCGDWGTTEYGCTGIKNYNYMSELWLQRYTRMSGLLADIVERTEDKTDMKNINAAGRVMRVYTFAQLTDMYGDIPYFEGGYGYEGGVLKPKYDEQKDIYADFFKQLEIANEEFSTGTDVLTYDQYYGGDVNKWRKYANSLRLRLAMRLVKIDPELAKEQAAIAIENGVMESNDDLCLVKYENFANPGAGPGRGNALANRFCAEPRNFRYSRKLISYMEQTGDPRLRIYGACYLEDNVTDVTDLVYAKVGSYSEMARPTDRFDWENYEDPNNPTLAITVNLDGSDVDVAPKYQYLQPNIYFTAYNSPYVNMSYSEVELLEAEAALRWGLAGGDPSLHYSKALKASVDMMTVYGAPAVDQASVDAFVQANALVPGKELEQINMQQWVGFVFNPFECYANWRRTNIPEIIFYNYDPARNESEGKTPRRMEYPAEEQLKNPDNYAIAIQRVKDVNGGKYDWLCPVWWDKQ